MSNANRRSEAFVGLCSPLEPLESRTLMGADNPLYYPEGFVDDSIAEFVPITNPNNFDVTFELHARYEIGERDQVLATGVIPANSRGGVTINNPSEPGSMIARPGTPYALVLNSSAPVAATLSHYDFGTAIGESFTEVSSTEWTFGEGFKDSNWTRDFVLFYNTSDDDCAVQVTVYTGNGQTITFDQTLGAQRRGGLNLNDDSRVPAGVFGVRVVATRPIVASLSHYEIVTERGFGALGTTDGGATAGFISAIEFEDRNRGHGNDPDGEDDDNPGNGNGGPGGGDDDDDDDEFPNNAYLTVLNTNDAPVTVTFTFIPEDDDVDFEDAVHTITVPANSRGGISLADFSFWTDEEFGVVYESTLPVTVTAAVYEGRDALGMEAVTVAATEWKFGEGFMSRTRAGHDVTEDVYIFNPTGQSAIVTIEFFFSNGEVVTVTESLSPLELDDEDVHQNQLILDMGEDTFYGVRVTSNRTIIATLEHWDRSLGGGFATQGIPGGTVVLLSEVLVL